LRSPALWHIPLWVALPACFMTADEDLWKQAGDTRPDQPRVDVSALDAPRPDAAPDAARDGPVPDGASDLKPDLAVPDQAKLDQAKLDQAKPDQAKPDQAKADQAKPDMPPPDLPKPDVTCKQTVLLVTANSDDGEVDNYNLSRNGESGTIFIGYWSVTTWAYFRFRLDQALPAGAVITGASLELWGHDLVGSWNSSSDALEILVEDAADALAAASTADIPLQVGGRPVTQAKVRWPTTGGLAWKLTQYNASSDLKAPLQELVNDYGGLAQNAHVQLWIRGVQAKQAEVGTHNFLEPGYAAHPHRLTISWCY